MRIQSEACKVNYAVSVNEMTPRKPLAPVADESIDETNLQ